MKPQRTYTTLKQSYELLEMGILADTADVYSCGKLIRFIPMGKTVSDISAKKEKFFVCPRWTYGRLMHILMVCATNDRSDDYSCEFETGDSEMPDMLEWIINTIHALIDLKAFDITKMEIEK